VPPSLGRSHLHVHTRRRVNLKSYLENYMFCASVGEGYKTFLYVVVHFAQARSVLLFMTVLFCPRLSDSVRSILPPGSTGVC
jgi:hypothetical protein